MRNFRVWLVLCPIFFLIGCFWGGSRDEKKENKLPQSRFVESSGWADLSFFKFDYNLRFKDVDTTWEKDKDFFYVVVNSPNPYEDYHILSLHKDSSEAEIYKIFLMDRFSGMWSYSFDTCMADHIKEKSDIVYRFCKKNIPIPESLYAKMSFFLLEFKPSVHTFFTNCFGDLNMTYYDGERNYYFDMSKPSCLDDNMKKDPRITEYIEFYNEMAAFIKQDFSECRWDNFGNKEKMIEECSQYNWKWRERYGK